MTPQTRLSILIAFCLTGSDAALGQQVCSGLTGSARTTCLQAQVRSGQERTRQIDEANRKLDNRIRVVCAGRAVGDAGAKAAGVVGGGNGSAAGAAWGAGRAVGSAATGGRDTCPK